MQKRHTIPTALALVAFAVVSIMLVGQLSAGQPAARPADAAKVARGEYLTRIMACNDCHTPFKLGAHGPEPDMSRMLSGHPQDLVLSSGPDLGRGPWVWAGAGTNTAFAGPWGVSFAANLTPDPETGLMAAWSERTFIQAMRTGRHEGQGRPILPPMPWPMYGGATDEDLAAIFAYLQTVPAICNRVPQPVEPVEAP
ncbi:MAG: diheme cytochrome c-553 [Candidatus Krumholzibacteriia bacterium]